MTAAHQPDGGLTTRAAYRDLTERREVQGEVVPRAYRAMDLSNLVAHFVKHVPHKRERWDQLLPHPMSDELHETVNRLRAELATTVGAPQGASWRSLVLRCTEAGEQGHSAFGVVVDHLVREFPEALEAYERVATQTVELGARAPSHCSYGDREGYVTRDAVLVVLTPDRQEPEAYHRAITCFRQEGGAARLPAERLDSLRRHLRRKPLDATYTIAFWQGSEP